MSPLSGGSIAATITSTNFPDMTVFAKPIIVAYQSSDQAGLAAATETPQPNHGSPHVSHGLTKSAIQSSPSSSGGHALSGGAIAGTVIGAICGAAVVFSALTFVILRFCLGYRRHARGAPAMTLDSNHIDHGVPDDSGVQHQYTQEAASGAKYELPSLGQTMSERAELKG